nr:endonuclease III [Candidatus Freyrarchaeum guaymaensis]
MVLVRLEEAEMAVAKLEGLYGDLEEWWKGLSGFEILVSTVISQNTNSRNTAAAFRRLREKFKVTPENMANAPVEEIEEALKPAGLYRGKARRLKELSRIILERYGGLDVILKMPLNEARKALTELPGVGSKTADVVLNFAAGKATFPVDTHIARIAKRWGIVGERAEYDEVSEAFKNIVSEERRRRVHLILIRFGRDYCTALNPKCDICPVKPPCRGIR